MDEFETEFEVEKETKNTVRYQEKAVGQPPRIGSLYVQKWVLGNPPPQKLKVKVTPLP